MKLRKVIALLCALALVSAFLTSCSPSTAPTEPTESAAPSEPVEPQETTAPDPQPAEPPAEPVDVSAYRNAGSLMNQILADAAPDGVVQAMPDAYVENDVYTEEQYNTFWNAYWTALTSFTQDIIEYCVSIGEAQASDDAMGAANYLGIPVQPPMFVDGLVSKIAETYGVNNLDPETGIDSLSPNGSSMYTFLIDALGPDADAFVSGDAAPVVDSSAYRDANSVMNQILADAAPDGVVQALPAAYVENDVYTNDQYDAFWNAYWTALTSFTQDIIDYCVTIGEAQASDDAMGAANYLGIPVQPPMFVDGLASKIAETYGVNNLDPETGIDSLNPNHSMYTFIIEALGAGADAFTASID